MSAAAWLAIGLFLAGGVCANGAESPPEAQPQFDSKLGAPFIVRARPALGSAQAPISIVEVSNFRCGHCRMFQERVFPLLRDRYIDSGKVRWIVINASDNTAEKTSEIFALGRCLERQGNYWKAIDRLFENGNRAPSLLKGLFVKNPDVDGAALEACLQTGAARQDVSDDFAEFTRLRIVGTPTFFIRKLKPDGTWTQARVNGYQSFEYFERVIDTMLQGADQQAPH